MLREARRLERAGFGGAANQVAAAAVQQKLGERPGFSSADTEIERQKLREQADRQTAAVQSGFRPRATPLGAAPDRVAETTTGRLGIDLRALSQTPSVVAPTPAPASTVSATPATPAPAPSVGMIGGKPAADVLREMRGGGFTAPVAATGSMSDFIGGVSQLTAADGRNMTRKDAVEELNQQRMQAGLPALDPESVLNEMLQQDRAPEQAAAIERQTRRIEGGFGDLGDLFGQARAGAEERRKARIDTPEERVAIQTKLRKRDRAARKI
jgi:hypothetical protein